MAACECALSRLVRQETVTTMQANGRDKLGRFAHGNPGGPGRPPLNREREYLETLTAACTVDDWREICQRAVKDAKKGDHRARDWLTKYLVGEPRPVPDMPPDADQPNPYEGVPSEVLLEAMAAIHRLKASCNGGGRD